jgi:hypothetical protein
MKLSPKPDAMFMDMSETGCDPVRKRAPSIVNSASNPTPMADNVMDVLLLPLAS